MKIKRIWTAMSAKKRKTQMQLNKLMYERPCDKLY